MNWYRAGIDIGGTFTDIVLLGRGGEVVSKKISSSVENYALAIVDGLEALFAEQGVAPDEIGEIMHGTTVASNAILERSGARVGLVTSRGFRDVLELRNLRMPRLYDLTWEKPPPLVDRYLRVTVDERVNAAGEVVRALARDDARRALRRLLHEEVDAIAVCLINSYANPCHERVVAEVAAELAPEHPCSTSFDVQPEIKEYERTSTTVVNAYVLPTVRRYLETLREGLNARGVSAPLHIMQSNGGLTPAVQAAAKPVDIVESGPAAGVVGARAVTRQSGIENVISFDMGGTTAKASLIEGGEYTRTREYSVGGGIISGSRLLTGSGYLLNVPAIDLAEVGAGGGSILWIDGGGSMQAGPRSAGARPGPACYGLGGGAPTVTDANVVLGYLNPAHFCGGELPIDAGASRRAIETGVAGPLGLDVEHASWGARQVAIASMIRAIRAVSSERGRDPRDYALFAFGGNGGLFAVGMAAELGMKRGHRAPRGGTLLCIRPALRGDRTSLLANRATPDPGLERRRHRQRLPGARSAGRRPARGGRFRCRPSPLRPIRDAPLPGADLRAGGAGRVGARRPGRPGSALGRLRARARANLWTPGRRRRTGRAGDRSGSRPGLERSAPSAEPSANCRTRSGSRHATCLLRARLRLDRYPGGRTIRPRTRRGRPPHHRGV